MMAASAASWSCPFCTYENQLTLQYCSMCNEKRREGSEKTTDGHDAHKIRGKRKRTDETARDSPDISISLRDRLSSFFRSRRSPWICPNCTCSNQGTSPQCEACGLDKSAASVEDCPRNNERSITSSIAAGFGKLVKFLQPEPEAEVAVTAWTCAKCTFRNHPEMTVCEECGSRPLPHPQTHPLQTDPGIVSTPDGEVLLGDPAILRELINKIENNECPLMEGLSPINQWVCPACTYNNANGEKCTVCERPRLVPTPMDASVNHDSLVRQTSIDQSESVQKTQERTESYLRDIWNSIVIQQKRLKEPFIDPEFPHSPRSLYINEFAPLLLWSSINKWARPAEISIDRRHGAWCVFRDPKPDDIEQGRLGDCWFLSALAVIAEVPELLQKIIITKEFCPQGVYLVRLCRDGLWKTVLVDDYFPVISRYFNYQLAFSKARRGQLWVPLIEKAMAKMYGSYESLDGGSIVSGLSVLTGYPCEVIHFRGKEGEETDLEFVWAKLLSFKESKFPMAASSSPVDPTESVDTEQLGIQPYHAYSILDLKQIGTESVVVLRDPWGHTKPGREWRESQPGTFMIGSNHLFKYFSHVDVCYYHPDWHSVRVHGLLPPCAPSNLEVLTFQTFEPTEINICLYQRSYRGSREESQRKIDMLILLVRYEDTSESLAPHKGSLPYPSECFITSKHDSTAVVTCSAILNPGRYAVIPLSFSNWHSPSSSHDNHVPYVMALFSAKVIEWQERVPTKPGFLSESLFLLARKKGTFQMFGPSLRMYNVHISRCLWFTVIENHDKHYHYKVSCHLTESMNVQSSRNGLQTDDCIPPQHRQVLMAIFPASDSGNLLYRTVYSANPCMHNPNGEWGSFMTPPLTDSNRELHSPRPLF